MNEIQRLYEKYLKEELPKIKHPTDAVPQNFILGDFSADSKDRKIRAIRDRLEEIANNSNLLDIHPDWLDQAITSILDGATVEDENLPAAYALMMYDATAKALGDRAQDNEEDSLTPVEVAYQVDLYEATGSVHHATPFLLMAYASILFALKVHSVENDSSYNSVCIEFYPPGISSIPVVKTYSENGDMATIPDPVAIRYTKKIMGDKGGISEVAGFAQAIMVTYRALVDKGLYLPINLKEWLNEKQLIESALETETDSAYSYFKREGTDFIELACSQLMRHGIIPKRLSNTEMRNAMGSIKKQSLLFFDPEAMVKKYQQKEGTIFPDNRIPCVRWQLKPKSVTAKRSHFEWGTQYSMEMLTSLVVVDETLKRLKGDQHKNILGAIFLEFHKKLRKDLKTLKARSNQVSGESGSEIEHNHARYQRAIAFYERFIVATLGLHHYTLMGNDHYEMLLSLIYGELEVIEANYQEQLATLEGQTEDDLIPPIDLPDHDYSKLPKLFRHPHLFLDFLTQNLRCAEWSGNVAWDCIYRTDAQIATPESLSWAIRYLEGSLRDSVTGELYLEGSLRDSVTGELWPAPDLWYSGAFSFIYEPGWPSHRHCKSSIVDRAYARLVNIAPHIQNRKMEIEDFIKKATEDWVTTASFADTNIGEERIPLALNVFSGSQILLPPYSNGQVEAIRQFADPNTTIYPMQRTPGKPIIGAELMLVTPVAIATRFESGIYRCFYPGEFPFEEARSLYTESGWLRQLLCQSGHRLAEAIPGANRWNQWYQWYTRYRGGFTQSHIVPDIDWGLPEARTLGLFERCLTIISGGDWSNDAAKREVALNQLFDYLLWALGYTTEVPDWEISPWSKHDILHQVVAQLPLWIQLYPADYFSGLINPSSISLYTPDLEEALLGCTLESGVAVIPNIEVAGRMTHAMQLSGKFHRAIATTNSPLHAKALLIGWLIHAPHLAYPITGPVDIQEVIQAGFVEDYLLNQEPDVENSPLPVILLKERSAIDVPASQIDDKPSGGSPQIILKRQEEQKSVIILSSQVAQKGTIIQSSTQQKSVVVKAQGQSNSQTVQAETAKVSTKQILVEQTRAQPIGQALPDLSALTPQRELVEIERTAEPFRPMELDPDEM
jgi:hypothetical protein